MLSAGLFAPHMSEPVKNILLFGLAGSTKSSYINSCFTALGEHVVHNIAASGGHADYVTTEYRPYRLIGGSDGQAQSMVRLWDTWGLAYDNYKAVIFKSMLHGHVKSGTQMGAKLFNDFDFAPADKNVEARRIHAVIFFIPAAELDTNNSPMLQTTKKFVNIALENSTSLARVRYCADGLQELHQSLFSLRWILSTRDSE